MKIGLFIPCYIDLACPQAGIATLELLESFGLRLHCWAAGSCVQQVPHYFDTLEQTDEVRRVRQNTFELVEFLPDILTPDSFPWAEFPHLATIHCSCSSIPALGIGSRWKPWVPNSTRRRLLKKVKGLVLVPGRTTASASEARSALPTKPRRRASGWTKFTVTCSTEPSSRIARYLVPHAG